MSNEQQAKTEGYKRGLDGESYSFGIMDSLESDSAYKARREGYEEGRRDRMRSDKGNK